MPELSAPIVIFWALAGAAVGALLAAMVARYQHVRARRAQQLLLRRRDGAIDRLKSSMAEHSARLKRQEDQLRELDSMRRDRAQFAADLEQARRELSDLRANLESTRNAAREAELRLNAALDAERQEGAARRAASAAELAAAQESALNLRAELASAREAASRATARLEADLATTRSLLERTAMELHAERTAATEARTELQRRVTALEDDRLRLETELSTERRTNAEKQSTLRSFVTTLREQYALACAERDSMSAEVATLRRRADESERALRQARDEFSHRLDTEHEESVELLSRVWEYVHNYPRLRDRPVHPPPVPRADLRPTPPPPPSRGAGEGVGAGAPEPRAGGGAGAAGAVPGAAGAPPVEREVRSPRNGLADAARAEDAFDIERALAEPPVAQAQPSPATPPQGAEPVPTPPSQPVQPPRPPRSSGPYSTTKVRRPVSAMRRDDDVLVICDDGSVWTKRPTGWTEEKPIPGSEEEAVRHEDEGGAGGPGGHTGR